MSALELLKERIRQRELAKIALGEVPQKALDETTTPLTKDHILAKIAQLNTQPVKPEITLNSKQQEFIRTVLAGASCILLGAAGTGKTTCTQELIRQLCSQSLTHFESTGGHKYIKCGTPPFIITSFTRRAINNVKKKLSKEIQSNCMTLHKALEYEPHYDEVTDPVTLFTYIRKSFQPRRNSANPLPQELRVVILEEASMCETALYDKFTDAIDPSSSVQWVFLGDLNQLPPVFGKAILGTKLLELPIIELTEVYRQALDSPIISLAHRLLRGEVIPAEEYPALYVPGKLKLHAWKKKLSPENALTQVAKFLIGAIESNQYSPYEDIILTPYNKAFGTLEINKYLGTYLAKQRDVCVYEILAGWIKHYLSVGDRVMYEKEDATVLSIEKNPLYRNSVVLAPESLTLDYWGREWKQGVDEASKDALELQSVDPLDQFNLDDFDLDSLEVSGDSEEERANQASHIVTLKYFDSEDVVTLSKSAEINALLLGYAITVHKAQGCEWNRVFCIFHQSQSKMIQRELLYTAVTRAAKELYVICEPETFIRGVESQRIPGNTLEEKLEYFKGAKV